MMLIINLTEAFAELPNLRSISPKPRQNGLGKFGHEEHAVGSGRSDSQDATARLGNVAIEWRYR